MQRKWVWIMAVGPVLTGVAALTVWAQEKTESEEQERRVTEKEVPPAALAALKKLAGTAAITEFSEEIEHGHKFYEGSWKGPDGDVDALVTESGDLVEIEEIIAADKAPAAVRAAIDKLAGKDAKPTFEKKTMVMYEAHFTKDGKGHEIMVTPDGRHTHEEGVGEGEVKHEKDDDDD